MPVLLKYNEIDKKLRQADSLQEELKIITQRKTELEDQIKQKEIEANLKVIKKIFSGINL